MSASLIADIVDHSHMSADFLLNLLNELGESAKMQAFPSVLSSFCHRLN